MGQDASSIEDWLEPVFARSEMGRLVRDFDWAATPLGPYPDWPEGLRLAVSMCLSSRFPALVVWGPDLIKIYNDGYRPILGTEKHPAALGAPMRDVWPEIWDYIHPLLDGVMSTATHFVLKKYKNEGVVIDEAAGDDRLQVSP